MKNWDCDTPNCPVAATLQLIGGKYKAAILSYLMYGELRYNEIRKKLPNVTDKMLTQQLRELERDELINRKVYPVVPPKTEYSLTEFGKTLCPILVVMFEWGVNYLKGKNNLPMCENYKDEYKENNSSDL